jgi:hypothetical protein
MNIPDLIVMSFALIGFLTVWMLAIYGILELAERFLNQAENEADEHETNF